ncbi:MAG: HEAT repeat domain-containing protein, partial [Planctomycetes bacterium]|nr:HEAT repeat domain-containing protein [Planctomycetota bacterium]
MSRTRFRLAALLLAFASAPAVAGPGLLKGKPRTDGARVPALLETLKNDPDEKKRKAAATDLGRADARLLPEVVPGLVAALQKDAAPAVRMEAADAISSLDAVFPVAGVALEGAASSDASPLVRLAAKKALWEYHLNGYRSPKGADGVAAQTVEPPFASPAGPRP